METSVEVLKKLKVELLYDPTPDIYPKVRLISYHRDNCSSTLSAALFPTIRKKKHSIN